MPSCNSKVRVYLLDSNLKEIKHKSTMAWFQLKSTNSFRSAHISARTTIVINDIQLLDGQIPMHLSLRPLSRPFQKTNVTYDLSSNNTLTDAKSLIIPKSLLVAMAENMSLDFLRNYLRYGDPDLTEAVVRNVPTNSLASWYATRGS